MPSSQEQWLINYTKPGQHRYTCPWCSPHRKKKHDTCLSVNRNPESILYSCHHGDCGASGVVWLQERHTGYAKMAEPKPMRAVEEYDSLDERHYEFLTSRGISTSTAHKFKLVGDDYMGKPALGFLYFDKKGKPEAIKHRILGDKSFACTNGPASFFGLERIKKGDDLYIVEGEMDVLALAEVGVNAISVPNGATLKVTEGRIDPKEDNKFRFLWDAKEYVDAAKRIVIATDADAPGEALAEEIARRVGKERCWRIKFPEGSKDSNDVLLKEGAERLRKAVSEPVAWPVQGLYDAEQFRDSVWELYDKGAGKGESTGYESVDELYTVVPGQVTIVTGIPSSGKSEFIDQIMMNLASNKGWKFGICSFENEPRFHIAKLMSKRAEMPFFEGKTQRMNREAAKAAFDWVNEHFSFVHQDDGSLASIDSILDRLRIAIMRFGIRGAVIDPVNFISRDLSSSSETEWVSNMLTQLKAFAMAHGVHIWLIAHPAKQYKGQDGKIAVPKGYDISGSSHYFNKADCGLTIHREMDMPHLTQVHVWKCRFAWVGKQGQTDLIYNTATTSYYETPTDEEEFRL